MNKQREKIIWVLILIGSLLLVLASWQNWIGLGLTEVLGFVTGAVCVWLTVKENIWNWPIGIANAAFFTVLFFNAQLYADMGLQVIYIILGFLGWYWWLNGGVNKTVLKVRNVTRQEMIILATVGFVTTFGMTIFLESVNDSAPFLDALTTVLSLIAQYLLTKKFLENWYVWISADVIYIGLYAYKGLYLTSLLYFIFLLMCLSGLQQWKSIKKA